MTTAVWNKTYWMQAFETAGSEATIADQQGRPNKHKRRLLACGSCKHPLTEDSARMEKNGAHEHRFFNPSGIIFLIGCFREAPGCHTTGTASREFSWFPGHAWHIAVCGGCLRHLGWRFCASGGAPFYGLILNRLQAVESEEP